MQVEIFPRSVLVEREGLASRAQEILGQNFMGGWTRAASDLYPHQWSWDSGFIAIGLAHLDTGRAARELLTLFRHQWKTGKVPHIVFNPEAPPDSYFPGAEHWACAATSPEAPPAPPYTSCLCQPPTHAIAAQRIWEAASNGRARAEATAFLRDIYPGLLSWHRYLLTYRDPEESGLVTIYHPWESGTDNSPRWDAALEPVEAGEVSPHERYDLEHVDDPSQRPTDAGYWVRLSQLLAGARLAGDRLASMVGVGEGRRAPARGAHARVIPGADRRRRLRGVLRAVYW